MAVEILAGNGIQNAFAELGINATMTYRSSHEPYYEIWEVNKKDLRTLEEVSEWDDNNWGWWRAAKGSNMGTAANFLTINGQFMIGWEADSGNDTYDSLLDYFYNGIGVGMESNIIALAVDLARANGMSVARLFQTFEG